MEWEYVPKKSGCPSPHPYWKLGNFSVYESISGWRIVGSPKFVGLAFQSLGMAFLFAEQIPQPEDEQTK